MTQTTQDSSTKSTSAASAGLAARPTVTVVVTHTVEDFDTWKRAFDEHSGARSKAGIVTYHVQRSVDSPNQVSVYMAGTDRAKLQGFLSSDDLKSTMQRAGVSGPPTITLMTPVEDHTVKSGPLYGAIISHEVADFDAWKKVYDEVDSIRRDAGIVGHAVNRAANDPNRVIVYHQAKSLESLQAFASSPDLKAAMKKAGVTSQPVFIFTQSTEWGHD